MIIAFTPDAWRDYVYWQSHDPAIVRRINELVRDTGRSPFQGIGKPEPLKGALSGWWSRRITGDHRLVCRVMGKAEVQQLQIAGCRFHYE